LYYFPAADDDPGTPARFVLIAPDGESFEFSYARFDAKKNAYLFRQDGAGGDRLAALEVLGPEQALAGDLSDINRAIALHVVYGNGTLDRFGTVLSDQGKLIAGTLYEQVDRLGNRTVLHYAPPRPNAPNNAEGRLEQVEQVAADGTRGVALQMKYGQGPGFIAQRLLSISEVLPSGAAGRELRFSYDPAGMLATAEGPAFPTKAGRRYTFAYDNAGNLSRMWDPLQLPAIRADGTIDVGTTKFTENTFAPGVAPLQGMTGEVTQQTYGTELVKENITTFAWNLPNAPATGFDASIVSTASTGGTAVSHVTRLLHDATGHVSRFYTPYVEPGTPSTSFSASYDTSANFVGANGQYAYDSANRLKQIAQNGKTISFRYDGFGQLAQRCDGASCTDLVLDESVPNARIVAELGDKRILYAYGPLGLAAVSSDNVTRFAITDDLGSVRGLVSATGNVDARYAYNAYGELRAASAPGLANNIGFAGEYSGPGDGVQWLRSRAYSPGLGRFLQRDEFAGMGSESGSLNRFVYTQNRPTVFKNPSGYCADCDYSSPLQNLSDLSTGIGDIASFGATESIRKTLGINDVVQECSWFREAR